MRFSILFLAVWILLAICPKSRALGAAEPALPDPGTAEVSFSGGVNQGRKGLYPLARLEGILGVGDRLALRLPLSLEVAVLRPDRDNALVLVGGLSDLWVSPGGEPLAAWGAAMAGRLRLGAEAGLRLGMGVGGALGQTRLASSLWLEGGAALVLDVGPFLTICLGFAYERLLYGPGATEEVARLGWVSDAHIQLLSAPLESQLDPPLFTVHLPGGLDLLALATVDIEARTRRVTTRVLLGLGGAFPFFATREPSHR